MHGDQTGEELLLEALRVLQPSIIRQPLNFADFDLSLAQRRQSNNQVVHEAAEATQNRISSQSLATITPEIKGDVGSPNAILREAMNSQVILRIGRRIPGIRPIGGVYSPIAIVRMAVDDAYGAEEWREPATPLAMKLPIAPRAFLRATSRAVAEFTFQQAKKTGARVFGAKIHRSVPPMKGCLKRN
jgi:isocitrate dehydrogenase